MTPIENAHRLTTAADNCAADTAGNAKEAKYCLEAGDFAACKQRMEWMVSNAEAALSNARRALVILNDLAKAGASK